MQKVLYNIFYILILYVLTNIASFAKGVDLVFINKTFSRDIHDSYELYSTFERFYRGGKSFYIIVPKVDLIFFKKKFKQKIKTGEIKKLPIFLTDEYIISKCDLGLKDPVIKYLQPSNVYTDSKGNMYNIFINDGNKKNSKRLELIGWTEQQVVKLCFSKTNLAKYYVTFDSDVRIIKNFDNSLFFDEKTGIFRTVYSKYRSVRRERHMIKAIFDLLQLKDKKLMGIFMSSPALYNSELMIELLKYTRSLNKGLNNFYDLIKASPWEINWVSQYIRAFHPDKFKPMPIVDLVIDPPDFEKDLQKKAKSMRQSCSNLSYAMNAREYKDKDIVFEVIQSTNFEKYKNLEDMVERLCIKNKNLSVRLIFTLSQIKNKIKCYFVYCPVKNTFY